MKILASLALLLTLTMAPAAEPVEFTVGAFTFERPEGWSWIVPSSPMRKAQLNITGDGGTAEVTFFYFGPGQGGSVQANVDRWIGQFQDGYSDTQTETEGSTEITFVKAEGTFLSGMPGTPSTPLTGYAMRGAILASSEGDVYVKMTGPEGLVKTSAPAFEKMVRAAAR